jgi:hypothetical protein
MTRDAYKLLHCNIHFADNFLQQPEGIEGYDPLSKIKDPLNVTGKGLQKIWTAGPHITIDESMIKYWTAGPHITIDESMIKYCGRVIPFIQYMPGKPIKHGIKVFCICCALLRIMLAYKVYCRNKDKMSMKLAKHLFEKYGWTIVGTIVPTDKKTCKDHDIPF